MHKLGIEIGADLKARSVEFLTQHFGKSGAYFHGIARGIDHRLVRPDRERKSIGAENTFFEDLAEFGALRDALQPILDKLWRHCEASAIHARTLTLKVKYADFTEITRSRSTANPVAGRRELETISLDLLMPLLPTQKGIRLLGVTLSSLTDHAKPSGNLGQMALPL